MSARPRTRRGTATAAPPTASHAATLDDVLEKEWQRQVVQLARTLGWDRIYHTHDSRRSAHGFPDLVFVRDRVLFVELKREKTRATPDQVAWLNALVKADAEVYLARPRNLDAIAAVLAARRDPLGGHLTTPRAREAEHELLTELRKELE